MRGGAGVHGARHAGPGATNGEDARDVVVGELLAGLGVEDGSIDAKEGEGGGAGLGGRRTGQGRDHDAAGLSLCARREWMRVSAVRGASRTCQ